MNFWGHLKTINQHKFYVMKECFKVGLYKQGLLHDLSKYSPIEFWTGVKYYQGNRSPNNAEREKTGLSLSWLHHKGRNKHHFEYWIDYNKSSVSGLSGMKMPPLYVIEMFIDRVAACKTYQKDKYTCKSPLEYYMSGKAASLLLEDSRKLLEKLLKMLAIRGEKETFAYIKKLVKRIKRK